MQFTSNTNKTISYNHDEISGLAGLEPYDETRISWLSRYISFLCHKNLEIFDKKQFRRVLNSKNKWVRS